MSVADRTLLTYLSTNPRGSTEALASCADDCSTPFLRGVARHHSALVASDALYVAPDAFEAFVEHGGNVPLYEQAASCLVAQLTPLFSAHAGELRLLDLGAGTGRLLVPLLARLPPHEPLVVVLVDQSAAMLDGTRNRILQVRPTATVECIVASFDEVVLQQAPRAFDVVLSSFALHYSAQPSRPRILQWIASHCRHFVCVTFDVDDALLHGAPVTDEGRFQALAAKFERGIAEYAGLPCAQLVERGFMVPVFGTNFSPLEPSGEVSAAAWRRQLEAAGLTEVSVLPVYDYWWAPCVALVATGHVRVN